MDTTQDTTYSAIWPLPMELAQREQSAVFRLRLRRNGSPVVPGTATFSLLNASGEAIVDAAAASIGASETTYTASGMDLTQPLGQGYMVRWVTDLGVYDIPAAIVRRLPFPSISDEDIKRRWPYLDSATPGGLVRATTNWQAAIEDAWITIQHQLIDSGRLPWLNLSASSLREPHLLLAGARIHEHLAARGNPVMQERADRLHREFDVAWSRVRLDYDEDDDGRIDDAERRMSASSSVWLGGAPHTDQYGYWRRR